MTARADHSGRQLALYAGLQTRNRVISVLRLLVPASGIVVLLVFIAKIAISSIASSFGIGQFSFPTRR